MWGLCLLGHYKKKGSVREVILGDISNCPESKPGPRHFHGLLHKPRTASFSLLKELEVVEVANIFEAVFDECFDLIWCLCHFADEDCFVQEFVE
jgi:hypothetical protein